MNWTVIVDIRFALGATACAAFLVYGAWLCRGAFGMEPPKTQSKTNERRRMRLDPRSGEISSSAAMPLVVAVLALGTSGIARLLA